MGGCAVLGCHNSHKKARMHSFPTDNATNKIRRVQWIKICNRGSWIPGKFAQMCEEHFEDSQYENNRIDRPRTGNNRKLKQTAIPTITKISLHEKVEVSSVHSVEKDEAVDMKNNKWCECRQKIEEIKKLKKKIKELTKEIEKKTVSGYYC